MTSRNRLISLAVLIACLIAAAAVYASGRGGGSGSAGSVKSSGQTVCRTKLPRQAQDTLGLIAKGGPFPYRSDGIVFENRENRLPRRGAGYYHEYTVVTPGSDDRGTRRIVTGSAGEQYWTGDHYSTFQGVDPHC